MEIHIFSEGVWKAGISGLSFVGALITNIDKLYFCAASIIPLRDLGRYSDRILTGHVWLIHSITEGVQESVFVESF